MKSDPETKRYVKSDPETKGYVKSDPETKRYVKSHTKQYSTLKRQKFCFKRLREETCFNSGRPS